MQASSTVSSMSLQWSVPCPLHWSVTSFTAVVTTSLVVLDSWSWSCLTRCERKRKSAHSLKRTVSPSELTGLLARRVSILGYQRTIGTNTAVSWPVLLSSGFGRGLESPQDHFWAVLVLRETDESAKKQTWEDRRIILESIENWAPGLQCRETGRL